MLYSGAPKGVERVSQGPVGPVDQLADSAFTRAARREILRDAVFLCTTPLVTPRISSGCAVFSASAAASALPEAMASSTLRI